MVEGRGSMLDFDEFKVLTFDCYGTLIDWETGIIEVLRPVLSKHAITISDEEILELYAEFESLIENKEYVNYRIILKAVMKEISNRFGFAPALTALDVLSESIRNWKPFPDTIEALRAFRKKYNLAIISNIDDDLFSYTAEQLEVPFDWVITAEQAKSYKPSLNNFYYAFQKIDVHPNKILHVAQSIHHDIIPAQKLGLKTVWVNRRSGKKGFGAIPPGEAQFDLEVPDLKTLATTMGLS